MFNKFRNPLKHYKLHPQVSVIILESSHFLYVTTQGHFLDRKRMVWEVMFLSLFYRKHSFRWLLLQWPHWLTACHLDLWAAGKKAGGRLEDKSKTDWGRTDDLPRTMLRGHMFTDGTMSLNWFTWYIRFLLFRERTWDMVHISNTKNI